MRVLNRILAVFAVIGLALTGLQAIPVLWATDGLQFPAVVVAMSLIFSAVAMIEELFVPRK